MIMIYDELGILRRDCGGKMMLMMTKQYDQRDADSYIHTHQIPAIFTSRWIPCLARSQTDELDIESNELLYGSLSVISKKRDTTTCS